MSGTASSHKIERMKPSSFDGVSRRDSGALGAALERGPSAVGVGIAPAMDQGRAPVLLLQIEPSVLQIELVPCEDRAWQWGTAELGGEFQAGRDESLGCLSKATTPAAALLDHLSPSH